MNHGTAKFNHSAFGKLTLTVRDSHGFELGHFAVDRADYDTVEIAVGQCHSESRKVKAFRIDGSNDYFSWEAR